MDDHPDLRDLGPVPVEFHRAIHPAEADLCKAKAQVWRWVGFVTVVTAIPVNVWLWGWAT